MSKGSRKKEQVMRHNLHKTGFSLIELLVVIAILAMLLAIIMPALSKSKELTRRVVCASNQKQIVLAMVAYGEDNDGWLANFSMPIGPHAYDIDKRYVAMMEQQYGAKRTFFYCPSMSSLDVQSRENHNNDPSNTIFFLGYAFWVPRYSDLHETEIPPKQTQGIVIVIDSKDYRGPKKITDPVTRTNPALTDEVSSEIMAQPNFNVAAYNAPITRSSCHQWRNRLEMINRAFADGRVENKKSEDLQVRYGYQNSPGYRWLFR